MKIIVLNQKNEIICAALLRDKLEALERLPLIHDEIMTIGSIYVGRVENCVSSIHAAFVRFQGKEMGYLPFSNVPDGALFNREYKGKSPLKSGDMLAVQVERNKAGMKQTALTGAYSLSSKLSAVTFGTAGFAVSKKIDDGLRQRMRDEVQSSFKQADEAEKIYQSLLHHALIIRTDAAALYEENEERARMQIVSDASGLLSLSDELRERGRHLSIGSLLYKPDPIHQLEDKLLKLIRFLKLMQPDEEVDVVCEDSVLYEQLEERMFTETEEMTSLKLHASEDISLDSLYRITDQINELQKRVVWLKSGGFLVIDKTEAMTVIDVNSGKNIKKKDDDFLSINLEAAEEALKQLRIRDVSGIIIIDFINMRHEATINALKKELKKLTKMDTVRTHFVDFTQLGLAELTREKH